MSELPDGWANARIGDVIEPFETVDPRQTPDRTFMYIDIGSIDNSNQTITEPKTFLGKNAPSRARRVVHKDDVLFSTVRTYLKNIAKVPSSLDGALTSTGIAVLRPSGAIDPDYLFRWTCSDFFVTEMSSAQDGTMYPAIRDQDVTDGELVLPPLKEQIRITTKLDSLFARTKTARAELDRIPLLIEHYKKAILRHTFAGNEGKLVSLNDVVSPNAPIRYGIVQPGEIRDRGIPLIRVCDLVAGEIAWEALRSVTQDIDLKYRNARVQDNDILVSIVGTIGRVALVSGSKGPTNIARAIARIRPNTAIVNAKWLFYRLQAEDCQNRFLDDVREVARKTLNISLIKETAFILPSIAEQERQLAILDQASRVIKKMHFELERASHGLDRLEASLSKDAFSGKLVAQDPSDEPASVLLERIRAERAQAGDLSRRRGGRRKTAKTVTSTGSKRTGRNKRETAREQYG